MRVIANLVAAAAALVLAAATVVTGYVYVTHPRDEQAYLQNLARYAHFGPTSPSSQTLLMIGDSACDWLDRQPLALWRSRAPYTVSAMQQRIARDTADLGGAPKATTIATAAWHHLCPAAFELRIPHAPFTHPTPD